MRKNDHIWDHFFPLLFPKYSKSLKNLDIPLWEVGAKRHLDGTSKVRKKKILKKLFRRSDFRTFLNQNDQIWDNFFSLLFPKDSESLKILDIQLREGGGKKMFKHYLKSEQTHRLTYRKHRHRGPMLWKGVDNDNIIFGVVLWRVV